VKEGHLNEAEEENNAQDSNIINVPINAVAHPIW
jgi:hypothetical protein|tara:strand:- start:197 stop:298 length:102 start_codon:yes stop_codon:yes gene_type:complete